MILTADYVLHASKYIISQNIAKLTLSLYIYEGIYVGNQLQPKPLPLLICISS